MYIHVTYSHTCKCPGTGIHNYILFVVIDDVMMTMKLYYYDDG